MLRLMATFRLNTFHWHLVDKQGWRLQLKTTAGLENCYTNTPGFYTKDDIKDVVEYAKEKNYNTSTYLGQPIVKFNQLYIKINRKI